MSALPSVPSSSRRISTGPSPLGMSLSRSIPSGSALSRRLSTPASPPPPQKTRARELLRKHYGLGLGVPGPGPCSVKQADPMDLDSPAFDAKTYYEQLITTSSLPTLISRENDLLTEIRELDSERQSLVYNHHHELIAASDTIAAMKSRAESLDADLDLLMAAFSEISRLGAEVAIEQPTSNDGDQK